MTEDIGPGAYDSEVNGSLFEDAKKTTAKASKKKVPFGASSEQRALPFVDSAVPGPGAYDGQKQVHVPAAGSAFKSETKRLGLELDTGDPGAYDPFTMSELAAESSMTFNKTSKPFGATAKRELNVNIFGADTPGPGKYDAVRPDAATDANRSVFSSGSSQRPAIDTHKVPGSGTYDPDLNAIKPNVNNSGAALRGRDQRFKNEASMTEDIGPGAYDSEVNGSLFEDAKKTTAKASKKNVPFGLSAPQRGVDVESETPAPGFYQPISPRFKDARSPARSSPVVRSPAPSVRSPSSSPLSTPKSRTKVRKSPLGGTAQSTRRPQSAPLKRPSR